MASNSELLEHIKLAESADIVAVDTETTSFEEFDVRDYTGFCIGVSIAYRDPDHELHTAYFPIRHAEDNVDAEVYWRLKRLIEKHPHTVYHNAKYDIASLKTINIYVGNNFYDTLHMAHWIDENLPSKALDYLAKRILKDPGKLKSDTFNYWFKVFGWSPEFPTKVMGEYAGHDASMTLRLREYMQIEFQRQGFDGDEF